MVDSLELRCHVGVVAVVAKISNKQRTPVGANGFSNKLPSVLILTAWGGGGFHYSVCAWRKSQHPRGYLVLNVPKTPSEPSCYCEEDVVCSSSITSQPLRCILVEKFSFIGKHVTGSPYLLCSWTVSKTMNLIFFHIWPHLKQKEKREMCRLKRKELIGRHPL